MRLGYIIPEFPTQTHILFWREITALEALGFDIRIFSTRPPRDGTSQHSFTAAAVARTQYLMPPRLLSALGGMLRRPRGTLRALAYAARLRESGWADRIRTMALVVPAADLVQRARAQDLAHLHVHSYANTAHLAAMARLMGGPTYSLTLHGDLPVYGRDHAAKTAGAAFVTTVTQNLADAMRAAIPGVRPAVITMGLDTRLFTPAAPPPAPPFRIVTVARLALVKGHAFVLRAIAALVAQGHDIRYTIVGEGPHRAEIMAEIARLGLGDRVTLTGALSEDGVRAQVQGAHALVLASFGLGESAPVAVKEAMSCALPVICTRIGGTAEMMTDGEDGLLVPQEDAGAIAAALLRLIGDPGLCRALGQAARARALRQFDDRALAARLADLFRAQAGRTGP